MQFEYKIFFYANCIRKKLQKAYFHIDMMNSQVYNKIKKDDFMNKDTEQISLQEQMADRLKNARKTNFNTARMAAQFLGIQETTYSCYENASRNPSYEVLARMCRAFGITPNYLLGFDDAAASEDNYIKILTESCLLDDEIYLAQREKYPFKSSKPITLVWIKSKKLGKYSIEIDSYYYKEIENLKMQSYKELIEAKLRAIRQEKTAEMNSCIEICRTFNFHINITPENYHEYRLDVKRFVIFQIFNYFLSPELANLSDDIKEKYNFKFFNNQFYNPEVCEQYGKIIPNFFRSPAIERYFLKYYLLNPREKRKIPYLENEMDYFKKEHIGNNEPDIKTYYRLQEEFMKIDPVKFDEYETYNPRRFHEKM